MHSERSLPIDYVDFLALIRFSRMRDNAVHAGHEILTSRLNINPKSVGFVRIILRLSMQVDGANNEVGLTITSFLARTMLRRTTLMVVHFKNCYKYCIRKSQ